MRDSCSCPDSIGEHRLSLRYDSFQRAERDFQSRGRAARLCVDGGVCVRADRHWRFTLEWLRVSSDSMDRVLELGQPAFARETQCSSPCATRFGSLVRIGSSPALERAVAVARCAIARHRMLHSRPSRIHEVHEMGKGDGRSRRGKIYQGSFGKSRPKDPAKKKRRSAAKK